jgi:hypothetical protein
MTTHDEPANAPMLSSEESREHPAEDLKPQHREDQ